MVHSQVSFAFPVREGGQESACVALSLMASVSKCL